MNFDLVLPLSIFIVLSTITPGPNNLLLTASGLNFGFRATIPHLFGIHCGIYSLAILCALGLGSVLLAEPRLVILLKVFGSLYLAYLAWMILGLRADAPGVTSINNEPLSVRQAFVFQFSNPKAWFMATTGINLALPITDSMAYAALFLCLGFATLGLVCNFVWIGMGRILQNAFTQPIYRRWINATLALLTALTIFMIWLA